MQTSLASATGVSPWVSTYPKCQEAIDTKSFQLVSHLTGQLDSQRIFVPCEARILWYSADRTSSRALRDTTDFTRLVRQRQPERLDPWLQRATTSAVDAIRRFATGLYEDYEAVKAGVTLSWNSGPVEGHINRLKMLKRQMFGRARLDLLSRRFVLAPRERL